MRFTPRKPLVAALAAAGISVQTLAQQSGLVLEEIIVTAQKRVESLADTPMTVNVVTGEQIAEFAAFSFQDLSNMTAGLVIEGGHFDTDIATRGLGTDLNAPIAPRVTVYFDGAFISQQRGLFSGLYDLAQFELLRGPQGTLYGQTSPAGAITIRSQNPNVETIDGYLQQSFTEHDGSNSQFGLSLPLIENELAIRVSGLYDQNENSDIDSITLDRTPENETTAFRVVGLWQPSDAMSLRVAYHDIEDEFDIDPVVRGGGIDSDDRIAVADLASEFKNETDYLIGELSYTFANDWTANVVASSQDNTISRKWDDDASEVQAREQTVISDVPGLETYEFRLASQGNDFWDWTVGAFYQDSTSETPVFADTYQSPGAGFILLTKTTGPALIDSEVSAVFTHNTLYLTDKSTLTVGLRYNDEESTSEQVFQNELFSVLEDGSLNPIIDFEFVGILPEDQETNDDAWTGTLKYQYQVTDDLMAYGSYDRGWRRGSANVSGFPNPPVFGAFDAEDSDNIELGYKWNLWGGRGLWNLAVYYQLYSDFQYQPESVEFVNADGGRDLASPVVNVDEAESYGLDTDITVLLTENWNLSAALSYNKAELSDAEDVPCTSDEPLSDELFDFNSCDLSGERAGGLPEWSGNIASEYWRATGLGDSEWYLRGLFNAESEYYSSAEDSDLDSYTKLDLFIGLRSQSGSWDVNAWVKNITDEDAELKSERRVNVPDYANGGEIENPYVWIRRQLAPRTVGITASYRF